MEVPDKLLESTLSAISDVLLENESEIKKKKPLKKLAKNYAKLIKVVSVEFEHDLPFFET